MREFTNSEGSPLLRDWGILLMDAERVILARQGPKHWKLEMTSMGLIPGTRIDPHHLARFAHRQVKLNNGENAQKVILAAATAKTHDGSQDEAAPVILDLLVTLLRNEVKLIHLKKELGETPFELQKLEAFYKMTMATEGARMTTQELINQSLDFIRIITQADKVVLTFPQNREDLAATSCGLEPEVWQLPLMKRLCDEKTPILISEWDEDPDAIALLTMLNASAVMAIPIVFESGQCGATVMAVRNQRTPFTEEEAELVAFAGLQLGLALENAELREQLQKQLDVLTEELHLARSMQQAVLPSEPIQSLHVEIFGFTEPSRLVGGDFFDYWHSNDGSYIGVVGDIMGKGVGAALLMSFLRAHVRAAASDHRFGPSILEHLSRNTWQELSRARVLATLSLFRFEPITNRFTLLTAGHHPPLLVRSGQWQVLESGRGVALGLTPAAAYQKAAADYILKPGDTLILCSDGLMEFAHSKQNRLRVTGLIDIFGTISPQGATDAVAQLRKHLNRLLQAEAPKDDVTVLALSVPPR